jgi:hypothetical protein
MKLQYDVCVAVGMICDSCILTFRKSSKLNYTSPRSDGASTILLLALDEDDVQPCVLFGYLDTTREGAAGSYPALSIILGDVPPALQRFGSFASLEASRKLHVHALPNHLVDFFVLVFNFPFL